MASPSFGDTSVTVACCAQPTESPATNTTANPVIIDIIDFLM
jgi:hypothetical protein